VQIFVAESFEMWFMFRPSGGQWVPLKAVNWSWSGSATNNAGTFATDNSGPWTLESGTNSVNPPDFEAHSYPVWNSNITNETYIPSL
jgi:hypothetical protein